jgi:hypothetical protein
MKSEPYSLMSEAVQRISEREPFTRQDRLIMNVLRSLLEIEEFGSFTLTQMRKNLCEIVKNETSELVYNPKSKTFSRKV